MSSLRPRSFVLFLFLLTLSAASFGQVIFSDDFESNAVGVFPAGWTQVTGSVGYAYVTDSPVAFGTRAVRLSAGLSTASTIRITTAITNDYSYEYEVLIPDTGNVNETIGSVKVENVGMQFALGATTSDGIIYFSSTSDGFAVPTNVYHHVKVDVDYQKNVAQVTVNGGSPKKYPISISTSQDLRLEAASLTSTLQKHIVFVDSVSVALMTVDLTPAYVTLSNPADNSTNQGATSAPSFSWSAFSQATGYTLQISSDSTFAGGIVYDDTTITGTSKSVPLPPLAPATTYFWRVKAKNTIGWGDWSTVRRFRTVDPPSAPVTYNPSQAQAFTTTDDVYFSFSTPSGSDTYQFQVADDSLFASLVVNDSATSANSWRYVSYPPLEILKTYYWRIRSFGVAGWGPWSPVQNFSTPQPLGPPTLGAPANGAVFTDQTQIYFWWNGVSGGTEYWLVIAKDSNFTDIVVSDSTLSTSVYQYYPPLEYNTTYYWKVRTGSPGGWGAYSGWRTFRTKPTPTMTLSSPANGSIEDDQSIYLYGTSPYSDNADSVYVQIALDSLFTQVVADSTSDESGTYFDITRFTPGTTYYWRMRARNVAGWGAYSARRTFTIASPPPAPTLSSPANNAVVTSIPVYFTWNSGAAANVQDFRLQIATDSLFTNVVVDTVADYSGFYAGTGKLAMDTRYYWRVRTRSFVGSGPYSVYRWFLTPQRPTRPVITAPVAGTMDVFGTVNIRWQAMAGKDSSHIQLTLDTNDVPLRVMARTLGAAGHYTTVTGFHYGPVYSGTAEFPVQVAATDNNHTTNQLWINGQGFSNFDMPAGTQFFIRVRDFNEAGASDWSEYSSCSVLREPTVPTGCEPVNGSTGFPFLNGRFSTDPNTIPFTSHNVTVADNPALLNPIFTGRLVDDSYDESNRWHVVVPQMHVNSSFYYQFTAYNGAGLVSTPVWSSRTADPAPVFTCIMDIVNDQGGFEDVDFIASELDFGPNMTGGSSELFPFLYVSHYSLWRQHPEWSIPIGYKEEIRKAQEQLPDNIRQALLQLQTTDLWEPIMQFPAIGEDHYRVTVKSRTDSGKHGTGWETFVVIAHASTGHLFRSRPDSGYSVDNLAPAPPVGGSAAVASGGVRVTWVANDEADLKEYVVYRSLNQNDPISSLTPIGTTTETTFLDPSPPQVPTAYYYIVARDKNENDGEPAIIAATIVTGVETLVGIPTEFVLGQNYPNPFNPTTTIKFGVPERSSVRVQVINTLGQVVEELVDAELPAGYFQTVWEARVPSGLYFARMVSAPSAAPEKRFSAIKKMVLLR